MKRIRDNYAAIMATLAFVVAVTGVSANAAGVFVTSKQIRNGTILTQDIRKGAVRTSDLQNGGVKSGDIANGEVEPQDVTMPAPEQLQETDTAKADFLNEFAPLDVVGAYTKEDPASVLQVEWTGTASGSSSPCIFQLRVDGKPSASGGGEIYVGSTTSVAASALFEGLAAGPHQIEVWARLTNETGEAKGPCTVGPAEAGISQTFIVSEQVI